MWKTDFQLSLRAGNVNKIERNQSKVKVVKHTFLQFTQYRNQVRVKKPALCAVCPITLSKQFPNLDLSTSKLCRFKKEKIFVEKIKTDLNKPLTSSTMCFSLKYASAGGSFSSSISLSILKNKLFFVWMAGIFVEVLNNCQRVLKQCFSIVHKSCTIKYVLYLCIL